MAYYGQYAPYVPVATRRANAQKKMDKLRKKGQEITPVQPAGRKIATTFWGKGWCDHIESFSDYDNRLPRGRTYIRNGSVCHLAISKGEIKAIVSGSSLYQVSIGIKPLAGQKWQGIKTACTGQITSLLDLLNGQLSDGVMKVVCDPHNGLFPQSQEITLNCSCPDWATMCKHVAAVLYGIGTRLDSEPKALFVLRGVNYEELIDVSTSVIDDTLTKGAQQRVENDDELSALFGIDFADVPLAEPRTVGDASSKTTQPPKKVQQGKKSIAKTKQAEVILPRYYSGFSLKKLRQALALTQKDMADKLKLSTSTVSKYEKLGRKKVCFSKAVSEKAMDRLWRKYKATC